jgi:hypothetical protein
MAIKTSAQLMLGATYSRKQLRELFGIKDATLETGIFRPAGYDSIWLFITENKAADRTPYVDRLEGENLHFEGQTKGRTDQLIKEHRARGLELLLFHRNRKDERPDYSFLYEGQFEFVDSADGQPTKFHLRRVPQSEITPSVGLSLVTSEAQIRENIRRFARDAVDFHERARPLIAQTTYWVFDTDEGTFGPSKFVGYERMTFQRYESAVAGAHAGDEFSGGVTREAIEELLGEFKSNTLLRDLLKRQIVTVVEEAGISEIDHSKWAFATIRPARGFWALLCNPEKFDGLGAAQALDEVAWTVHRGEFHEGDRIAIWQSRGAGADRGIIAVGEVSRGAIVESCPEIERPFCRVPIEGEQARIRVRLARGGSLPLWESVAPWLQDLAVARARGGTVFTIEPEQWHAIVAAAQIETIQVPASRGSRRAAGQGYGFTPLERRAVERHAQRLAEEHFISLGFQVEDVSACRSYDLHCTNGQNEVRVEVKGTTGAGEVIILTRNEVAHAREQKSCMALVVVSDIRIARRENAWLAEGGSLRVTRPWAIDDSKLDATQFEYRLE